MNASTLLTSEPRLSERFRSPNADVTLSSCDGVLFKFFRRNLEVHSGAFSGAEALTAPPSEIIHLTETSEVVDILLQLMSPQNPPDLTSLEFSLLAPLAEAVEKYQVFPATTACDLSMRTAIPYHSTEVLEYAVKHNHVETMNAAALESVGLRMSEVEKHLSPEVFVAWAQYLELWLDVFEDVHTKDPDSYDIVYVYSGRATIEHRIGARAALLKDFLHARQQTLDKYASKYDPYELWREYVIGKVKGIPKFNTLLSTYKPPAIGYR